MTTIADISRGGRAETVLLYEDATAAARRREHLQRHGPMAQVIVSTADIDDKFSEIPRPGNRLTIG